MGFQNPVNVYFNVVYFDNKMQTFKHNTCKFVYLSDSYLHISKTEVQYGIGKYR